MALKIGAILLASANFLSANLISVDHGHVVQGIALHQHTEPLPAKGIIVKDYTIGKDCDSHEPGHHHVIAHGHGHSAHHADHHSVGHGSHHSKSIHSRHADSSCDSRSLSKHSKKSIHSHHSSGHSHGISYDRHINVNKKFVNFKQIGDVDRDDK